jgi:adenine deaminase
MNDDDMIRCARTIEAMKGGQVAVLGEKNEILPLPIAGLMSPDSAEEVVLAEARLDAFCAEVLGITLAHPMAALSFMSLPVVPNMRITDQGLFRVLPGAYPQKISLFG